MATTKSTPYAKMTTPDIWKLLTQLDDEEKKLRKGIDYLQNQITLATADATRGDHPEWRQNVEEWQVYIRANRNMITVVESKRQNLHKELKDRNQHKASVKAHKDIKIASLTAQLNQLHRQLDELSAAAG